MEYENCAMLKTTPVFEKNWIAFKSGKRRAINQGGTSSSKTFSIIQLLVIIGFKSRLPRTISICSESFPHLQKGAIRDFKAILGQAFDDSAWNITNSIYTFPNKTFIEFFSIDDPAKCRGPRRDILFINEVNNNPYEAYDQLDVRTKEFTFLDYNPTGEFWLHEKGLLNDPENVYIHSTYLDAKHVLPESIVKNIESHRDDPNWWRIYGLGEVGKIEGLVYPNFDTVLEMPQRGKKIFGLDFGFSNDPTALVECVSFDGRLYGNEMIYETNLTNQDIVKKFEEIGIRKNYDEIIADCAEPKSIEEIYRAGYNIKPCAKGADSVEHGHQKVNQFKQVWTKRSLNGIKEQRNFRYIADKNGKFTDKTTHMWSHLMDARRYAVSGLDGSTYNFAAMSALE